MNNFLKIELDPKRVFGLDILRSVAILLVLVSHSNDFLPKEVYQLWSPYMVNGVTVFFVLSGFLIGGIIIKILEREPPTFKTLFNFWVRRWFRTVPNYFFVLILLALIRLATHPDFTLWSINRYFFFSQNLFYPQPQWFFMESWSLSVEEWFYLTIPAFMILLLALRLTSVKRTIVLVAVLVLLLATCYRVYWTLSVADDRAPLILLHQQVIARLDSLMYGVIGAYVFYYHKAQWARFKTPLFAVGVILFLIPRIIDLGPMFNYIFSISVDSLATLLLIPYLSDIRSGQGFIYKAVTYIALISYSMYLLNLSFIQINILNRIDLESLSYLGMLIKYVVFWSSTIVLSIILYKYFELPVTKLRDKAK